MRLEAIKVLMHVGKVKPYKANIPYVIITGKDSLLKLGETHVFNILVYKLSSDPIQVTIC